MNSIYRGSMATAGGRALAWADSLLVDHGLFRLVWSNWGVVVPGRLYRCNHPPPDRLAAWTRRYGLRTLINLRGEAKNGSDALTRRAAERLGLAFVDAPLKSRGAPPRERMLHLLETFRTMQAPALMHCKSGADRAGLASALFVMAQGGSTQEALRHLSWRYGHIQSSGTGVLDAFFLRYQQDAEGRTPFAAWLRDDYDEAALRRDYAAGRLASFVNDRVLARE